MHQYRITTQDFSIPSDSEDECYLSPDDPIHDLKAASMMGGLGSAAALAKYNELGKPSVQGSNKGQIQREQNIQPGTDEWFKLWFGDRR